jgi:hypothetical protein
MGTTDVTLKQSAVSDWFELTLKPAELNHAQDLMMPENKRIQYRQITGIFRDAGHCYVVWGDDVSRFLHEPGKPEYEAFMNEFLARVRSSRGA